MIDRIVLVDEDRRRHHVLALAHSAAIAELVGDWTANRRDTARARTSPEVLLAPCRLTSLRDFLDRSVIGSSSTRPDRPTR
ncbi:MAG: hypothetical protein AAGA99_24435 [Actinomycetota bacterium]